MTVHAQREIVDLGIQPSLSIAMNLRKLRWIDGGFRLRGTYPVR